MVDALRDALAAVSPQTPGLIAIATALLGIAGGIARRTLGSIQRQGKRIGDLERARALDVVRRYQLEATLLGLGVPLPLWPDGPPRVAAVDQADDVDQLEDADPGTTEYRRPPLPPMTDEERHQAARHRRQGAPAL